MNKKIKIVSTVALASLLTLNVFNPKTLQAAADGLNTRYAGVSTNISGYSNVISFVLNTNKDTLTLSEINTHRTVSFNEFKDTEKVGTGEKFMSNGSQYTALVYGDVDGNGSIGARDARMVAQHVANNGTSDLTELQKEAGDVDANRGLQMRDARQIAKFVANDTEAYVTDKTASTNPSNPDQPSSVTTKFDKITTDNTAKTVAIDVTFDVVPKGYRYTVTDKDGNELTSSSTTTDNTATITVAAKSGPAVALNDGEDYTLTVTDKSGNTIKTETFTYRVLHGVSTYRLDNTTGINANNQSAFTITVDTGTANSVERNVEITLTDTDKKEVKMSGKIAANFKDAVLSGNVSSLKDGKIEIKAKVFDANGNIAETATTDTPSPTIAGTLYKGTTPANLVDIKTVRVSDTNATVDYSTEPLVTGISLSKVYYKVVKDGDAVPSATDVVADNKLATTSAPKITINTGLSTGNMYNIYMVTENNVGTLSAVITAPIANDTISTKLDKVTKIVSNGDGTFTWTDNQEKVTGYTAQLVQKIGAGAATVIAEQKVTTKSVDFSAIIKEQKDAARYTVNIVALGDYKTINNSDKTEGDINNNAAKDNLDVAKLNAPTVTGIRIDPNTKKLEVQATLVADAPKVKVEITKGLTDKNNAFVYTEENIVYSKVMNKDEAWSFIDISNFKDGAYRVDVSAVTTDTNIKLIDSAVATTKPVYVTVKNGVSSYEVTPGDVDITAGKATADVKITPVKLDGFTVTYKYQAVKADNNGEYADYTPSSASALAVSSTDNTAQITTLDPNSNYRIYLEVVPVFDPDKNGSKDITVGVDIENLENLVTYADIKTKTLAFTTPSTGLTVAKINKNAADIEATDITANQIAVTKDGKLFKRITGESIATEVKGSNVEELKSLVSNLDAGDKITVVANATDATKLDKTVELAAPTASQATKNISLADLAKDANLIVNGDNNQLVIVSGNIGKGTVTLAGASKYNIQGLTIDSKEVTSTTADQTVFVSNGTKVVATDSNITNIIINNVKVSKSTPADPLNVIATDADTITIPVAALTDDITIDTELNKTVEFTGVQTPSKKAIITNTSNKENTITVRTGADSKLTEIVVNAPKSTVNIENVFADTRTYTDGKMETKHVVTVNGMTITPKDKSKVTISKNSTEYKVDGKVTIAYNYSVTDAAASSITEVKTATAIPDDGLTVNSTTFTATGEATYKLEKGTPAGGNTPITLTIELTSGAIIQK